MTESILDEKSGGLKAQNVTKSSERKSQDISLPFDDQDTHGGSSIQSKQDKTRRSRGERNLEKSTSSSAYDNLKAESDENLSLPNGKITPDRKTSPSMLTPAQQDLQAAKAIVFKYQASLDTAFASAKDPLTRLANAKNALDKHCDSSLQWRGVDPFNIQTGPGAALDVFYKPLLTAFSTLQRRDDMFHAGFSSGHLSEHDTGAKEPWVCSMGHLMGLFDAPFLDIPPTGRLCFVRYCEFSQVDLSTQKIVHQCIHIDILNIMHQAGVYPLPDATGVMLPMTPGPRTHDGIVKDPQPEAETEKTLDLLERMNAVLTKCNEIAKASGNKDQGCPPELLAQTWCDDMLWYGPAGIGSTGLTIRRYQRQHQMPFRQNLVDKTFHGHVARIAEGHYESWFGWPNLTNRASGGFMGLPGDVGSAEPAEWRVVDLYRREGDKIAENWIFIDMLHYLKGRGLDVLGRMKELRRLGD